MFMIKKIFVLGLFLNSFYSFCQYTGANTVINNGNMRFGNGTESSINISGNLLQPWYYSVVFGAFRPLTYTSGGVGYALDSKFGVGGDGTDPWNLNGDVSTANATMTGQSFDTSGFNIIAGIGRGTVKVKGIIKVAGFDLEIINSYKIDVGGKFIEITTTAKNVSPTRVTNLRYWVGTKDDWVGTQDCVTKERGNLVGVTFQQLALKTQRSSALRISTADEGILFFTTSSRGNNSHTGYGDRTNPSESINPDTADITITGLAIGCGPSNAERIAEGDGSYSMYVRMKSLAFNESDSFTWYYAAAALDELDDVIADVADASCPTCIPDTDRDGILDPLDGCPYAAGVAALNGCPWPLYIGNNYKSTTTSNSIEMTNEGYLCSLSNSNYYNIAYHSGASAEPVVGDSVIYNNDYAFSHSLLFDTNGFAFMKLRDYNKIVEVQKSDGKIVAIYNCL